MGETAESQNAHRLKESIMLRSSLAFGACLVALTVGCGTSASDEPIADGTQNIEAPPDSETGADKITSCGGFEPFWSLAIDGDTVAFDDGADTKVTMAKTGPASAMGSTASFAALYQGTTKEDPSRVLTVAIADVSLTGCSDGGSDELFPFSATIVSGKDLYLGCCGAPMAGRTRSRSR
jgi:uncharacterized membrane protein